MNLKLSICIPTYNFGAFIGETLDSILPQMNEQTELVILDSNSQDQTESVCLQKKAEYPNAHFRYVKSPKKQGIDRDIEAVTNMAHGEYIWLFSADDILLPDGIKKIFSYFHSNHDIYLSEHILCDLKLNRLRLHPIFWNVEPGTEFDFSDENSKLHYLSSARTTEAFFSFLSTPIFKKSFWDRVPAIPEEFYSTCWGLAGRLLTASKQGLRIKYPGDQLLLKRGENDSFANNGRVNRFGIAIEGYAIIANTVFGKESVEAFHIRRVLRFDVALTAIMVTKLRAYQNPKNESLERLNKMITLHYYDPCLKNLISRTIYKFSNRWILETVYHLARFSRRQIRRLRNA